MQLDRGRFPTTAGYLDQIPGGLASFPDCRVRREVFETAQSEVRHHMDPDVLPAELASLLHSTSETDWVPETHLQTVSALLIDHIGEDAYQGWVYEDSSKLFQRPLFRQLMKLVSPTLMVMGTGARWSALHKGSTLTADPVKRDSDRLFTIGTVQSPPHLFEPIYARALGQAFKAALEGARGKEVTSALLEHGPSTIRFRVSWRRR